MPYGRRLDSNIIIDDSNYSHYISAISDLSNCYAISASEAGEAIQSVTKAMPSSLTTMEDIKTLEQRISILEQKLKNQQLEETNQFLRNIKW